MTWWRGYDFDVPSKAVFAKGYGGTVLLTFTGVHAHALLLCKNDLEPPQNGIWVWEGFSVRREGFSVLIRGGKRTDSDEWDFRPRGEFRDPTVEELVCIQAGKNPWPFWGYTEEARVAMVKFEDEQRRRFQQQKDEDDAVFAILDNIARKDVES